MLHCAIGFRHVNTQPIHRVFLSGNWLREIMPFPFRILIIIHRIHAIRDIHLSTANHTDVFLIVEIGGITQNGLMAFQLIGERSLHANQRTALFQIDDNILGARRKSKHQKAKNQDLNSRFHHTQNLKL